MHRAVIVLVSIIVAGILSSCGSPKLSTATSSAQKLSGYTSVVQNVVELIHDGTGWVLNKNQVKVEQKSPVRVSSISSGGYVADYTITVIRGDNSFSSIATDLPCDKGGNLTDVSVDLIREAVEDIKSKIDRFQN